MIINKASNNAINLLKSTSKKELVLDGLWYFKDVLINKNISLSRNILSTWFVPYLSQKHY